VYAIVQAGASRTSTLSLLITVIGGRAIGLAVRYAAGSTSQRPGALDIAGALAAVGLPVTLVATVAAVYLLAGELGRASLGSVLHKADWRWGIAGLARRGGPGSCWPASS